MIIDSFINSYIDASLLEEDRIRNEEHKSSGKLSASMLYQPTRFQVLKTLGAPRRPIDAYTLGKFKRGRDVEDWYVGQLDKAGVLIEKQKEIIYRGCIGYIDAVVDSDKMQSKHGPMPHEVKSVTNAKLKRIGSQGVDWHYQVQAGLYAIALMSEYYAVDIVSAEDLRPTVYIFQTNSMQKTIDQLISNYDYAMSLWNNERVLPRAVSQHDTVNWTLNTQYAMFDEEWFHDDEWALKELTRLNII